MSIRISDIPAAQRSIVDEQTRVDRRAREQSRATAADVVNANRLGASTRLDDVDAASAHARNLIDALRLSPDALRGLGSPDPQTAQRLVRDVDARA
jgi:hypothetical protein